MVAQLDAGAGVPGIAVQLRASMHLVSGLQALDNRKPAGFARFGRTYEGIYQAFNGVLVDAGINPHGEVAVLAMESSYYPS